MLRFGKKNPKTLKEDDVESIVQRDLAPYIKREELVKRLKEIQSDDKKKQLWDSLPNRKKRQLLRYIAEKRRASDGQE